MHRISTLTCVLLLAGIICITQGKSQILLLGAGAGKTAAVAGFTGPGDIVAFSNWWGIARAYDAATRGTRALEVCNVSDVACADLSTHATTGLLVVTTIGGSDCSSVTCTCRTIYDKVGSANLVQTTIANRPVFNPTGGPNSLPACVFNNASSQQMEGTLSASLTQPASAAGVVNRTGNTTNFNTWASTDNFELLFTDSANTLGIYAGTAVVSVTANDNTWHAQQALFNGASSSTSVDGTSASGNAGSPASGTVVWIGTHAGASLLAGRIVEFGLMSGNQSASFSALNSNAHSVLGF